MAEKEPEAAVGQSKDVQGASAAPASVVSVPVDEGPRIEHDAQGRRIWRVGNLTYTVGGLVALFFWLLWIDFTFTLMEGAFTPILQFKLVNDLKAPAYITMILLSIMPKVQTFFLNPWISIASDRHRGPRGRRIPYLLWPTPIACGLLALMGYGDDIAIWLNVHLFSSMEPRMLCIFVFGFLFFSFSIVNLFLGSVFYYLFNDVVPKEHIIKFFGYFRAMGVVAGMVYNYFIFQYSNSGGAFSLNMLFAQWHMDWIWYPKVILVAMAVFYLFAFSIACLRVREPHYPPPPPLAKGQGVLEKIFGTLGTLTKECFSHPFYTFFFFVMTVEWMQYQMGTFQTPMLTELHLDLGKIGTWNTYLAPIPLALTLLSANFGDYIRPVPLFLIGVIGLAVTAPIGFMFLIPGLNSDQYFYIWLAYGITHIPVSIVNGMAFWPLLIEMLPKSRYGQFSAALVMTRELVAGILGGLFASWVMTKLQYYCAAHGLGDTFYTRFSYLWRGGWQILLLICTVILYKKWKNMGGKHGFKPPVVWEQEYGTEPEKAS